MSTAPKLSIDLAPTPGFCIKSTVVNPATVHPPQNPDPGRLLEPTAPIFVPAGRKVFVNICYDKNVPPPPPADEETIKRAMNPQEHNEGIYYVPVVVSQPREDEDKGGNPSLVLDCVYNSTLKSRSLRDPDFKIFLVELALQRIEAQTALLLSRQIGTPNILAKGKLEPRRVWVPTWLAAGKHGSEGGEGKDVGTGKGGALIEVVGPSGDKREDQSVSGMAPKLKGVLKHSKAGTSNGTGSKNETSVNQGPRNGLSWKTQRPTWTWKKEPDERLKITVDVPNETPYEVIISSTLDIEPRRLILHVPGSTKTPPLDLDLDLGKSDAEIVASAPGPVTAAGIHGTSEEDKVKEPNNTLLLKRQQDFNVDTAHAEWRVTEGKLVVCV